MKRPILSALIQYEIRDDWTDNINRIEALLKNAAAQGAELAILPEMFVMPYDMNLVPEWAESIPGGRTSGVLSKWAKKFSLAIVGGSLAEKGGDGNFYNTATLWNPDGELIAKHRKMHLFDVDLPGGVSFKESVILTGGNKITVADCLGLKIGLAVCYDVRFPEIFRLTALAGADLIALPGAFNQVSGPNHWETLLRNRAMENTCYVAGVSGLSPKDADYQAWGHSMMVDPFARITTTMGRSQGFGLAEIDPAVIEETRARLPVMSQRRDDLYSLKYN